MERLFLTDYLIKTNKRFKKVAVNLIVSPAGSGKSSFITGDNGLINNTKQFYNEGIYEFFNFSQQKQRVLIVTDNLMNRDVLSKAKDCQKLVYKDIFKAKNINCVEELVNNETGVINVMTYAKLIHLLRNEKTARVIEGYIDLVVMDEIHNLFNYSLKFDDDSNNEDKGYFTIIERLNKLSQNTLVIGLTATPHKIRTYYKKYPLEFPFMGVLTKDEIEKLISHTEEEKRTYFSVDNAINDLCVNKVNNKVLIYTKRIATCQAYKEKLANAGYNVEYLCTKDKMNKAQKALKKHLIKEEKLPQELDILIINEAYQTGWNLKDDIVQTVIINDSEETTITQARNRVRHDIKLLIVKLQNVDAEVYTTYDFNNQRQFIIDEQYLNKPLSTQEFNEVKDIYGTVRPIANKDCVIHGYCSKTDFIDKDLNSNGYVYNKGMIIRAEDENNADKELKKQLNKLVDKKLYKDDQKELAELVNINIRRNRKLLKSIDSLNSYFKEYKLPFLIISMRIKENGKLITIWKVNKARR